MRFVREIFEVYSFTFNVGTVGEFVAFLCFISYLGGYGECCVQYFPSLPVERAFYGILARPIRFFRKR